MKLSVLDLIDLRVGQTVGESLRASRELVRAAVDLNTAPKR